ncbi:tRNA (cytidine56-2'-O)-methyltransferase [Methanococcus voltae]|uniref:tRNA (cytidine(56)-2'-O)-methyltransferase n=1 Tax=Methanococcus voltae TaxID=2188 RepID=UPI001AE71C9D|nr:tRNA (cytidine(56)-2'-O)-methyltransferase [Methanococcus voltae]MBP2142996.1 tRNA (cytidine56-2'-O)-methyltransferase [Methanococcus voltae]
MIEVMRLGHRGERDKRISTHVALTSRALGASNIIFTSSDKHVNESVDRITDSWGGDFQFKVADSWKSYVKEFKKNNGVVAHLTMYGENINEIMPEIIEKVYPAEDNESNENKKVNKKEKEPKNLLVIIGAEKVPREAYELADYNVSVGNQPHSEVAAIAIFLDRLTMGKNLYSEYEDATIRVIPCKNGKNVIMSDLEGECDDFDKECSDDN